MNYIQCASCLSGIQRNVYRRRPEINLKRNGLINTDTFGYSDTDTVPPQTQIDLLLLLAIHSLCHYNIFSIPVFVTEFKFSINSFISEAVFTPLLQENMHYVDIKQLSGTNSD